MTLRLISSYSTFLLFLFFSFPIFAQDSLFYDKDWKKCKRPKAVYYGFFTKEKGKWIQRDYFLSNHQLQSEGAYSSKKKGNGLGILKVGPPKRELHYKGGVYEVGWKTANLWVGNGESTPIEKGEAEWKQEI